MAWDSDTAATQLTSIAATEKFFSTVVTLTPREISHVQVDINFVSTPTDDMLVAVYTTLDDSSERWDLVPWISFVVDKAVDPNILSFNIGPGVYRWRVGVVASGATDTHTSADLSYRSDGVDA